MRFLIIGKDQNENDALAHTLETVDGCVLCKSCSGFPEAETCLKGENADGVFVFCGASDFSCYNSIRRLCRFQDHLKVVLIVDEVNNIHAIDALNQGVCDYMTLPWTLVRIKGAVQKLANSFKYYYA